MGKKSDRRDRRIALARARDGEAAKEGTRAWIAGMVPRLADLPQVMPPAAPNPQPVEEAAETPQPPTEEQHSPTEVESPAPPLLLDEEAQRERAEPRASPDPRRTVHQRGRAVGSRMAMLMALTSALGPPPRE
jgi:hypothetical protein